jgi:hypothetical protein
LEAIYIQENGKINHLQRNLSKNKPKILVNSGNPDLMTTPSAYADSIQASTV